MAKRVTGDCCPYCGGINGYEFCARVIEHRNGGWGEGSECVDFEVMANGWPKTAKCTDCGRRVDRRSAEGER